MHVHVQSSATMCVQIFDISRECYDEQVGYQSHSLTEMSNRTQDNALDVRQALLQCGTSLADLQVVEDAVLERAPLFYALPMSLQLLMLGQRYIAWCRCIPPDEPR